MGSGKAGNRGLSPIIPITLLADGATQTTEADAAAPGLEEALTWARDDLNLEPGEGTMITVDLPYAPPTAQVVLVAQAPQAATQVADQRVIGACRPIDYRTPPSDDGAYWEESGGGLGPATLAREYFWRYENRQDVERPPLSAVEVLIAPQHGVVKLGTSGGGDPQYNYIPDVNYLGKDKVTFRVTTSAGTVVVQYYLVVTDKGAESKPAERFCNRPAWIWKISFPTTSPSLDNAALQSLLDATRINNTVTVINGDRPRFPV